MNDEEIDQRELNDLNHHELRSYFNNEIHPILKLGNLISKLTKKDELIKYIKMILEKAHYVGSFYIRHINLYLEIHKLENEDKFLCNHLRTIILNPNKKAYYIDDKVMNEVIEYWTSYNLTQYDDDENNGNVLTYDDANDFVQFDSFINFDIEMLDALIKLMYNNPTPIEQYKDIPEDEIKKILTANIYSYLRVKNYNGDYDDYVNIMDFAIKNGKLNLINNNNENKILTSKKAMLQQNDLENYLYNLYVLLNNNPLTKQELHEAHRDDYLNFLMSEVQNNAGHKSISRKGGRKGMDEVYDIVLNLKRDFKKVKDALTMEGAQKIVAKHNENSVNKWTAHNADVNGDNIPDIIIRNSSGNPVIVNGWTTRTSDYPMRYIHANDPNKPIDEETGKPIGYAKYKQYAYGAKYNDDDENIYKRGNLLSQKNPIPEQWNLKGYSTKRQRPNRMSAYNRFKTYILNPFLNEIYVYILAQIENPPKHSKIALLSKVSAMAWDHFILRHVAQRQLGNNDTSSEVFKKFKNSKTGKEIIDNTVSFFYLHLFHTNVDEQNPSANWTEDQRNNLVAQFEHFLADNIEASIRNIAVNSIENHHYDYEYNPENENVYHQQNPETDGPWGNDNDFVY